MNRSFEYCFSQQSLDQLQIEDIGNCCIQAYNDLGECFYLVIKTCMGNSSVLIYGPYFDIIQNVSCQLYKFQYSEKKLSKIIDKFLNSSGHNITQAMLCDYEDIEENIINPKEYLE